MKKILSLIMICAIAFMCVSCKNSSAGGGSGDDKPTNVVEDNLDEKVTGTLHYIRQRPLGKKPENERHDRKRSYRNHQF